MRISFRCRTNHGYCAVNTAIFRLANGTTVTVDRDETEAGVIDGILNMRWRGCYLCAINDFNIFDGLVPCYMSGDGAKEFEKMMEGASVSFDLDTDGADNDYFVECDSFTIEA